MKHNTGPRTKTSVAELIDDRRVTSERIRGREKLLPWRRPWKRSPLDSDTGRGPDVRPAHCEVETLRPPLLPPLLLRAVLLLVGTTATPAPDTTCLDPSVLLRALSPLVRRAATGPARPVRALVLALALALSLSFATLRLRPKVAVLLRPDAAPALLCSASPTPSV